MDCRRYPGRGLLAVAVMVGLSGVVGPAAAARGSVDAADTPTANMTEFAVTATVNGENPRLSKGFQGFSVESADFAHGFLTRDLLAQRLSTLGEQGVIRLGGYSMDLVWPAFGAWADVPAPAEAIGGTVDQSDLDALEGLLDATGWKVTLGAPLKTVIDPGRIKNPTRDPSPPVTLDQVVAEVTAAHQTLGDDLLGVELGNEFDNVTTYTDAEMWANAKTLKAAIDRALPDANLKVIGPSANTAQNNNHLTGFVTAAQADESSRSDTVMSELASHWYTGSHCGSSTMTIPQLMSSAVHVNTRTKLDGIVELGNQLHPGIPMTVNESNSASCSGMPGVSNSYASSLWALDHLLNAAGTGVDRLQFHTNTAAVCGDFKPRESADYPISYRYYGAFCASDQAALAANQLSASPLYYGAWAFRQVPAGQFLDVSLPDGDLGQLRAYGVLSQEGTVTIVLINVQDPATAGSTTDAVTVQLPAAFASGTARTLRTTDAAGLASLDAGQISVGGQHVSPSGSVIGAAQSTLVPVEHQSATVAVAPGTAQIVTFAH